MAGQCLLGGQQFLVFLQFFATPCMGGVWVGAGGELGRGFRPASFARPSCFVRHFLLDKHLGLDTHSRNSKVNKVE